MGNTKSSSSMTKKERDQLRTQAIKKAVHAVHSDSKDPVSSSSQEGEVTEEPGQQPNYRKTDQVASLLQMKPSQIVAQPLELQIKQLMSSISTTQLEREGKEFTKADLVFIVSKLCNNTNPLFLNQLSVHTVPDLRAVIRILIFTSDTTSNNILNSLSQVSSPTTSRSSGSSSGS